MDRAPDWESILHCVSVPTICHAQALGGVCLCPAPSHCAFHCFSPVTEKPSLAGPELRGRITTSTFALNQPRCIFDTYTNTTDEIWLVVVLTSGMCGSFAMSCPQLPPRCPLCAVTACSSDTDSGALQWSHRSRETPLHRSAAVLVSWESADSCFLFSVWCPQALVGLRSAPPCF